MRKKYLLPIIGICMTCNMGYARDATECTASGYEQESAWLVNTVGMSSTWGSQENRCMTTSQIYNYPGVDCWRLFNIPVDYWYGTFGGYNLNDCYITVPAGYALNTDFVFDEDRYDEMLVPCGDGNAEYCPGGHYSYGDIQAEMGATAAFSYTCSYDVPGVYTNTALSKVPDWDDFDADYEASAKTSCYLKSGTYYDETGTFEITENCYYQE